MPSKEQANVDEATFKELVSAALKVDPRGLSGKHSNLDDPMLANRLGVEINQLLLARGLSQSEANAWWNLANEHLGGETPLRACLRDAEFDPEAFALVRAAAERCGR